MSNLVTPSAKAHERVTGRWLRHIEVGNSKDWFIYYTKLVVGSPIPLLFLAIGIFSSFSRAGSEIAAWSTACLTSFYLIADRFSRTREFSFFRIGSDFFLLGFILVGLISAITSESLMGGVETIGDLRWVFLLYAFTYCWELFPGLNRFFYVMLSAAAIAAGYGLWQHFTGVDLLTDQALHDAPTPGRPFFIPTGFIGSPEAFGTLLATLIPFPVAAFFHSDPKDGFFGRWIYLAFSTLLLLALFWTYRPGLWMAGGIGIIVTLLMHARQIGTFIMFNLVTFAVVAFISYGSPSEMLDAVAKSETSRAEAQRTQINAQVALWQKSPVIGVGHEATKAASYDPGTGNVYFHMLAETGVLGGAFYLLFILRFLLMTYRIFPEIPSTHYWHRVLIAGGLGSQVAFHAAGLYWSTLTEALALNLFIVILSMISYINEHYSRGLVSDDVSL